MVEHFRQKYFFVWSVPLHQVRFQIIILLLCNEVIANIVPYLLIITFQLSIKRTKSCYFSKLTFRFYSFRYFVVLHLLYMVMTTSKEALLWPCLEVNPKIQVSLCIFLNVWSIWVLVLSANKKIKDVLFLKKYSVKSYSTFNISLSGSKMKSCLGQNLHW